VPTGPTLRTSRSAASPLPCPAHSQQHNTMSPCDVDNVCAAKRAWRMGLHDSCGACAVSFPDLAHLPSGVLKIPRTVNSSRTIHEAVWPILRGCEGVRVEKSQVTVWRTAVRQWEGCVSGVGGRFRLRVNLKCLTLAAAIDADRTKAIVRSARLLATVLRTL